MKKSLIALAVMAAAGAASAQSSVQIYGLLDGGLASIKEAGVRQTKIDSGLIDTSRVGLKGSEDLGGGLKAVFTLEKAIGVDTGTAAGGFDREASIGLAGGFGEIKGGKVWSAFDDLNDNASAAFASNVFKPTAYVFASHLYNANPNNGVRYTSPTVAGFTGVVSYAFGENKTTTTSADKAFALGLKYENGPLMLGAAYQKEEGVLDLTNGTDTKYGRLNAAYDFGVAKLLGSYGYVKEDMAGKTNEYQIGVDVPLASNLVLSGGYATSQDKDAAGVKQDKRTGLGLALAYTLSKRTTAYVGLNRSKTKNAGVETDKITAYGVGVRHAF